MAEPNLREASTTQTAKLVPKALSEMHSNEAACQLLNAEQIVPVKTTLLITALRRRATPRCVNPHYLSTITLIIPQTNAERCCQIL